MRRIALHEYLSQIEGLVDDNRLPEAAAHCHFVLQQYPRHIGAYRLFGRALLEQQLYDDAIDIFERLLNADPEDLVPHAGLALAYSEGRDLERAIWHMERAFEVDPYNRAVQDELRKLYIARDGDAPPRLSLTRAALARLHMRAALFQQASAELTQLVAAYPNRVDLKLALAETLYRNASVVEAAALCREVLATLPFCIKANAILADALLRDELVDEARVHLKRVQDLTMLDRARLDRDTTLGLALSNSRISLPEMVKVEVLEDTLAFAKGFEESGAWPETATAVMVEGEALPDWLQDLDSPGTAPTPEPPGEVREEEEPARIMDWLDEVAAANSEVSAREVVASSADLAAAIDDTAGDSGLPGANDLDEPTKIAEESLDAVFADLESEAGISGTAVSSDSLAESTSGPEAEPLSLGDELDGPGEIEDEEVAMVDDTGAPVWEDERLLALDELRSYIDEDSKSARAGATAPEWLDELSDRAEVTDELPQWLHEAVGFDAPNSSADLLNPQQRDESPSLGSVEASSDPVSQPEAGQQGAGGQRKPEETEDEAGDYGLLPRSGTTDSAIPDWLLESDDVLDEMPDELSPAGAQAESIGNGGDDNTMTWLDELSEQLLGGEHGNIAQDAISEDDQEDQAEEPPADTVIS